ncbi:MAG TPA: HAMP domain-containing sensor histidine kinase [Steroidobacteraceae bacterium]|jgi:signal transduction histidine kinase|nr:HAMP domain-containing sensor histidine kinase [Steroidobacteraceae bacterium]
MLRLYLRFYIALLASLVLFVLATATLWHFTGGSVEQAGLALGRLVQNILPPADSPAAEQQEALRRLAVGLNGDVTLFDRNGMPTAAIGRPLSPPGGKRHDAMGMGPWDHGSIYYVHLADGRWLAASVPIGYGHPRFIFHIMLTLLALAIGIAAFPIVRQITRRLERLQHGVESLGAGDLTARVAVEGRDEVARLASSFNRAAGQIEQLVQGHKALLANASHELRTPLARIRLAVELLKDPADTKRKLGLDQDIAELDWLVDEILLASRLDVVTEAVATEELDLLALAAEECARYDDAELEGALISIRGDARLLRRLLRNLLENARRHGAPPTQVRIARAAAGATITVWDSGPGVPPSEFEHVFRPFYRPKDAPNRAGTGLGLALVRQIARRHGGDARCTLIDGRCCFVVTLPA